MKKPFRFYRGEFNGNLLLNLMLCMNDAVSDIVDELVYHANMTWKLEDEIEAGELPIREEDLLGIAKFAGVFRPVQFLQNTLGSVRFTESHVVAGSERSERGLFNMVQEKFGFIRTANDDYPTGIVDEASSGDRMTLIPNGTVPIGYVPLGVDIFEPDGTLIPGNLLSEPPVDGTPYTEYYGDKFLTLEEVFNGEAEMRLDMFKAYFGCVMRIRQNGASVEEFMYITELLGAGYIYDIEIVPELHYYIVWYSLNLALDLENKSGRLAAWIAIVEKRFKDFVLTEREEA